MKKNILTIILAIALVAVSIRLAMTSTEDTAGTNKSDASQTVIDCIMTRHSVRSYKADAVPDSTVEKILKAGMAAPTACNQQAWELVVVNKAELKDTLGGISRGASMIKDCAFAIVVCGNKSLFFEGEKTGGKYWDQDCSAVTENMLLAAHALGLGAVWCGVYPMEDRMESVRTILNLPDNLIPLNVIAFGYPTAPGTPKDKWDEKKVHYNAYG